MRQTAVVQYLKQTQLNQIGHKIENNWRSKTLENLEKEYWDEPTYNSHLVITCYGLRKKPLVDFTVEDLRIMIGQNIGLKYLIPLALEKLNEDVLAEGDLFEGDLLNSVLTRDKGFWRNENDLFNSLEDIISKNEDKLKDQQPKLLDTFYELKRE